MTRRGHVHAWTIVATAAVGLSAVGHAQLPAPQAPPQRIQVSITQLVPEMALTWEDLIKNEQLPAQKKSGLPWRHTYGSGVFGRQFIRVTIVPLSSYAQADRPNVIERAVSADALARYNAKVRPAIMETANYVYTLQQNISLRSTGTAPLPFIVVQTAKVLPGKAGEFAASIADDYLPAYRRNGVKDYWVYAVNFGAPAGQMLLVRPIANYAQLDEPVMLAGVPQEAIARMNDRRNALLTEGITTEVYRFIPELSYGMPAASTGATK